MVLLLVLKVAALMATVRLLVAWWRKPRSANPFQQDDRQPPRKLELDQKMRDKVIKQCTSWKHVAVMMFA